MRKKIFWQVFRRRVLVVLLLLIQIVLLASVIFYQSKTMRSLNLLFIIVSYLVLFYVVSRRERRAYKLTWVLLLLIFPTFGGLFYLFVNIQSITGKFSPSLFESERLERKTIESFSGVINRVREEAPEHITQAEYLQEFAGFPVFTHTKVTYLTPGEKKFASLIEQLEKAEKYIFLEYFIIGDGLMWDAILKVLKRKAGQGVDVRLIYDDLGCFLLQPKDFPKQMAALNIKCCVFNPFMPFLTVQQNNRDHRKIVSIDGKVAFTGGINIADEYINARERFGHWKDASVMLEGEAAWSITVMFLQMWALVSGRREEISAFYPWKDEECAIRDDGFVQPYADSPTDMENVGEHVYLQIINGAKKYLYINTPYLIIDDIMVSAITLAAKSGVDVRITVPYRWDKWIVHMTTRSYYRELITAGVKIYEYTRGFMHSKTFVSDDSVATVGSTNLDFRSLYLHFECGVWMCGCSAVSKVHDDYLQTLEHCKLITESDCRANAVVRLFQEILRIFAPLM